MSKKLKITTHNNTHSSGDDGLLANLKVPKSHSKAKIAHSGSSARKATASNKDTVYVEADEEITTVIDRVVEAKHKVVALVLPKRATVFQSVVNVKLLKKAADGAKKNLVIISSESAINSIAASAGVYVAKTLNSKPEIPKLAKVAHTETTIAADELDVVAAKPEDDSSGTESSEVPILSEDEDTIEMTEDTKSDELLGDTADVKDAKKKPKLKIPDFSKFQVRLGIFVVVVVAAVIGWVFGFIILPEATVIIDTDTSKIDIATDFVAVVDLDKSNLEDKKLKALKTSTEKTDSVIIPTTGKKDIGKKAIGRVTFTAKNCSTLSTPEAVSSGATTSSNGNNFITQDKVSFSFDSFDGTCLLFSGSTSDIVAAQSGEGYNVGSNKSFVVVGRSEVSGIGNASGGTTELVGAVSEDDINNAEDQLAGSSTAEAVKELEGVLSEQQLLTLRGSLEESEPKIKHSAAVDAEADELTVTRSVVYSMVGISADDVSQLLESSTVEKLQDKEQNIRSNGMDSASYSLKQKIDANQYEIAVKTIATIGPEFDEELIKTEIMGKERGDVEKMLESREGVRDVLVEFSPFWVFQIPDKPEKITILINEES